MELIDVFDENNIFLGYCLTRKEVHDMNLWHRHVSCYIMNKKDGSILMQKRSLNKIKNPGMWAKTGGHVESNEDPNDAIIREVYEEIGLKIDKENVNVVEIFKGDHYFSYGYIFYTDKEINSFKLQKNEVDDVKYFKIEELEIYYKSRDKNFTFCKWDEESFNRQMELLKEFRNKIIK